MLIVAGIGNCTGQQHATFEILEGPEEGQETTKRPDGRFAVCSGTRRRCGRSPRNCDDHALPQETCKITALSAQGYQSASFSVFVERTAERFFVGAPRLRIRKCNESHRWRYPYAGRFRRKNRRRILELLLHRVVGGTAKPHPRRSRAVASSKSAPSPDSTGSPSAF